MAAYAVPAVFGLGVYLLLEDRPTALEAAAVAWGVGWAAVNLISFVANQYSGIPLDETFYTIVSGSLAVAGTAAIVLRRDRIGSLLRTRSVPAELRRGLGLLLFLVFAGFLLFVLYKALIIWPAHPDELIYHMELPKEGWLTGSLPLHPGLDLVSQGTAYPDLLVTQQLWIYLGAGTFDPNLVRPIMPVFAALLLGLVFVDAKRAYGLPVAGIAAAALFSAYTFSSLTIRLLDDVPVAFYAALGLHYSLAALEGRGSFWRAGLLMGFAGLVKYNGILAMLSLAVALAFGPRWHPSAASASGPAPLRKPSMRNLLVFIAAGGASVLPLLGRNLVRLGNPVYPFFFGGLDTQLNPALLASLETPAVFFSIANAEIVDLLATVLVAALFLGLIRHREWTGLERTLLLSVVVYLPPYLSVPLLGSQVRYLAPVLPAIAIFAGRQLGWWTQEAAPRARLHGAILVVSLAGLVAAIAAWAPFFSPYVQAIATMDVEIFVVSIGAILLLVAVASHFQDRALRRALTVGLVVVLISPGVVAVAAEKSEDNTLSWTPYLLPVSRDAYLGVRIGPDWLMWEWMNANLGTNATVLSFEPRVFYLEARVVSAISPEMMPTYKMTLPAAVSFVRSLGVSYVLDSEFGDSLFFNGFYVAASPIFKNLANRTYFVPVHQEGSTVLYAITQ